MAKDKKTFTEGKVQTANKHLGKHSTSLITKEIQNNITFPPYLIRQQTHTHFNEVI